jgi:hypothetical protein
MLTKTERENIKNNAARNAEIEKNKKSSRRN